MKQHWLSKWYNRKFDQLSAAPDPDTWQRIAARLDGAEPSAPSRNKLLYAAAVLVLATGAAVWLLLPAIPSGKPAAGSSPLPAHRQFAAAGHEKTSASPASQQAGRPLPVAAGRVQPASGYQAFDTHQHTASVAPGERNGSPLRSGQAGGNSNSLSGKPARTRLLASLEQRSDLNGQALLPADDTQTVSAAVQASNGNAEDPVSTPASSRYFYAGLVGKVNNSWLFNNETLEGLRSSGLDRTIVSIRPAAGLVAGYAPSSSLVFEFRGYFRQQVGQRYSIYDEGFVKEKEIQLTSDYIELTGKWEAGKKKDGRGIFLAGGTGLEYISKQKYLLNGQEITGDRLLAFSPGIVAGIDYVHPISANWMMSAGLRSHTGLRNLYPGNGCIPSYFRKTYLSDVNIFLSVSRVFGRRN